MRKVAFICYGNACRSQIAEGLSKVFGKDLYQAYSAGLFPLGMIAIGVYEIMNQRGIDISDQYSKGLDAIPFKEMDFVISMGPFSADHICPENFLGIKMDWDIPDPYGSGINMFEKVTELIERKIKEFIKKNFHEIENESED